MTDLRCLNCGEVITAEDCFCVGVCCTQCGKVIKSKSCPLSCVDHCSFVAEERQKNVQWVLTRRRDPAPPHPCPWLPCGGGDCATWGTSPERCAFARFYKLG